MTATLAVRTLPRAAPDTLPPAQSWRDQAACAGAPLDLFYPEPSETAEPAKRICRPCPVRYRCLRDALIRREPHGVWGGTTATERQDMRRRARAVTG